jgi:3-oxoacyl-[acyl-carrier-protein] synthase III
MSSVMDCPPMFFHFGADGSGAEHLITPAGGFRKRPDETTRLQREGTDGNLRSEEELYMNGAEVFAFTIRRVPPMVKSILEAASLTMDNVDAVVLHQANAFMLEHLRKKMKIPSDKFVVCFAEYGNTSSASIPLAIAASSLVRAKSQSGAPLRLLLGGFGVGLSWGAAVVDFAGAQLLPVIECGEEAAGTLETSISS